MPGLYFREIQNIVHHLQQGIGRAACEVHVLPLFGAQVRIKDKISHTDDAVQGRADFMAHVGQKLALCLVCRLGALLRPF